VPGRRLGRLLARVLLAGLVVPLWLAGCAGPHRPAASPHDQAVPVWRDFVRCARTHGAPNLPDPVVDDHGRAVWPSDALARVPDPAHRRVMDTCSDVLQRLPASALEQQAPTAAQIRALTDFAHCMRAHGIPDWPDPRSDGTFALPSRLIDQPKNAIRSQLTACDGPLDRVGARLDFVRPDAPPPSASPH